MIVRDRDPDASTPAAEPVASITLFTSPNWTAIGFLITLAFLHACNAIPAFLHQRWEGYVSAMLGTFFCAVALVLLKSRCEVCFDPLSRQIRLRSGIGRLNVQRAIAFNDVHGVRLTLSPGSDGRDSRVEVLCDSEDIECPPTHIPRQQALCLAVMMDVRLIKVLPDAADAIEFDHDRSPSDFDDEPLKLPRL